jgi:hypothetical protein
MLEQHEIFPYLIEIVATKAPLGTMVTVWDVKFRSSEVQGLIDSLNRPANTSEDVDDMEAGSMSG